MDYIKKTWLFLVSLVIWVVVMTIYGDEPLSRRDAGTMLKGVATVLLLSASLIAWRTTSRDEHDPSNPKYSAIDRIGWWVCVIGGIFTIAFMLWLYWTTK